MSAKDIFESLGYTKKETRCDVIYKNNWTNHEVRFSKVAGDVISMNGNNRSRMLAKDVVDMFTENSQSTYNQAVYNQCLEMEIIL